MITDTRKSLSQEAGNNAENIIMQEFFADLGWKCIRSHGFQNKYKHFDLIVERNGITFRVDVKAPKICSNYQHKDLCLILLEHTGITGHPGWLRGEADFILQMLGPNTAITYQRIDALLAFDLPSENIKRYIPTNCPIQEWFGRVGESRAGFENKDIIRWEPIESFSDLVKVSFYAKRDGSWSAL